MSKKTKQRLRFIVNTLYFAIIIAIIFLLLKFALPYVAPFIIALILVLITNPLAKKISNKLKIKERIPGIILILLLWVIVITLLILAFYAVSKQAFNLLGDITNITENIQSYASIISDYLDNIYDYLPMISTDVVNSAISAIGDKLIAMTTDFASSIISLGTNIVKAAPAVLLSVLVSILASVFLAGDYTNIRAFVKRQLSTRMHSAYRFTKEFLFGTIGKIVTAYMIIMLITCCELLLGFSIIGVKYTFLLAPLITIFDILPFVGCGTILIPWGIIDIILGNYKQGIMILVLSIIITIVRNIIEPKIVGKRTGVHPLIVLIGVYIGGKLFGFVGIIMLPLTIMFLQKLQKEGYMKIWKDEADDTEQDENTESP